MARLVTVVTPDDGVWPPVIAPTALGPAFTVKACTLVGANVPGNLLTAVASGRTFIVSNLGNGTPPDPSFAPTVPLVLLAWIVSGMAVVYYSDHPTS